MKHVVTIHGINSAGDWQEQLKGVLEPHFSCLTVKYPHYRRFGALKLVLEPWVLFGGAFLLLLLTLNHGVRETWWAWGILILGLLLVSHFSTVFRRYAAIKYVKATINKHLPPGERPHVIAHSFGTFIVGTIMKRFPDLRFDAIILSGCTLPTSFDWTKLRGRRDPLPRIRNEVAAFDVVLRAASKISRLHGLGNAGIRGFQTEGFHTLSGPDAVCSSSCNGRSGLHNVPVPFGHGDPFVGSGHAETFWLPFLWNIDGAEYGHFLEMCVLASDLENTKDSQRLASVERAFLERPWDWADGEVLPVLVEKQLRCQLGHPTGRVLTPAMKLMVDGACANVWRVVAKAVASRWGFRGMSISIPN